ncbi:hypothetical protein A3F66_05340 [candidate division TM6 bacterium RIFCSPHIGHO2_12_FULL_32_22]|nr:MAG: hypothetical protein A3F66_05340 [candidate division TM6 bacterium RIFCSPHIGHO2_12_FULL_32_22]
MKIQFLVLLIVSNVAFASDKSLSQQVGELELNQEVCDRAIGIILEKIQNGKISKSCPTCNGAGKVVRLVRSDKLCDVCRGSGWKEGHRCNCALGHVIECKEKEFPCHGCSKVDLAPGIVKLVSKSALIQARLEILKKSQAAGAAE